MPDNGFNGSAVIFNAVTIGSLRGINYSEGGPDVDVSDSTMSEMIYEAGIADKDLSVDFVGGAAVALVKGSKGTLGVAWQDGGTKGTIANAVVSSISTGGSMNGEISGSVVFKPSTAA